MKKVILYLITASMICCNYSCDKEVTTNDKSAKEVTTDDKSAKELCAKLERAFQSSSTSDLDQFFTDWNISVSSNTGSIGQNDTIKTIYDVYREFYSPLDLTKLGDWEWGNNLNSNSKYVAVQNKIYYAVVEKELFDSWFNIENLDSISDFRPQLNLEKSKILYLLPEYKEALNLFIGTVASENTQARYEFVRPYIPILYAHEGGRWYLATHPEVSRILLTPNKTVAKLFFRVGFQGGEATLEKKNNIWIITESRATWIE